MQNTRFFLLALSLVVLGAGCASTRAPAPVEPAPMPVEVPQADQLPSGVFKSVKGNLEAIRHIQLVPTGDTVTSPLIVTGEARLWYFEGSFPVRLVNQQGQTLVDSYASADGEWMTEDWVPFTAELVFSPPLSGTTGKLILMKDNPSGLPENDDQVEIPVKF